MIGILDIGSGNLRSVERLITEYVADVKIIQDPAEIADASKLILPGVGRFDAVMTALSDRDLVAPLEAAVQGRGTPFLGICVGMQILADWSEEGKLPGLGWISGTCVRFPDSSEFKVPHIGWSVAREVRTGPLSSSVEAGSRFYFLHSYLFEVSDPDSIAMLAQYGECEFAAMVRHQNVYGVQFHPEKSHDSGRKMVKAFLEL